MVRRDGDHYCVECNAILPWRYKGRQRIYCSNTCRNEYTKKKKST